MHIAYINKTDHKTRVQSQKKSLTVAYFDQRLHENYKLLFLISKSKHHKLRCLCIISRKYTIGEYLSV